MYYLLDNILIIFKNYFLKYNYSSIQGHEILKDQASIRGFVKLRKHLSQALHYLSQDMTDDGSFDETNPLHRSALIFVFLFFLYNYIFTMLRITSALFVKFFFYCFISGVTQIKLWEQNKISALLKF